VTGNPGKVAELRALLEPLGIQVVPDGRGYTEIQADTLEEVAQAGATELLAGGLKPPFVLEDSGLFVAALNGFPGVYSRHALDTLGCKGLLDLLADRPVRRDAHFEACLLYVDAEGRAHSFRGRCRGTIAHKKAGTGGFGFDPVFVPKGHRETFAQMDWQQKARLSHRGKAVRLLVDHLAKSQPGPGGRAPSKSAKT
jgi:XTP/dITP diphosphohydrolase